MFEDPPEVDLCSAEGFARAEVSLPEDVEPWSQEGLKMLEDFGLYLQALT